MQLDDPNPNPQDPPADPPADPPGNPPAATERPDWLPENLWDAEAGKARDLSVLREPAADLPSSVDDYKLPEIEGLDTTDPLIGVLKTQALANGIGQSGFEKIVTDYAEAQTAAEDARIETEMKALGDNATGRVSAVSTWLGTQLPEAEAKALQAMATTADGLRGLERLMNKGAAPAPRDGGPPPASRKTEEQIRAMMNTKEYSGRAHERNPAVIKEVEAWFEDQAKLDQAARTKG